MAVARFYDEGKNPDGASLPGVGLRDLEEEEFSAFPQWLQDSIDATGFYRKTAIREAKADRSERTTKGDNP